MGHSASILDREPAANSDGWTSGAAGWESYPTAHEQANSRNFPAAGRDLYGLSGLIVYRGCRYWSQPVLWPLAGTGHAPH